MQADHQAREKVRSIVENYLVPKERYVYGFARLSGVPGYKFSNYPSGISIGKKLDDGIMDSIVEGPTPEYLTLYKRTNQELSLLARQIAHELNLVGIETRCIEPTISTEKLETEYTDNLRTPLSHKMVATRAGLGWIGKTALLITKRFGPRLRFVSILVKANIDGSTSPINKSRCGKCNLCVEVCPANAATGQLWDTSLDRDLFFDAQKCRAQSRVYGDMLPGGDSRICGICVSVCPIGIKNR